MKKLFRLLLTPDAAPSAAVPAPAAPPVPAAPAVPPPAPLPATPSVPVAAPAAAAPSLPTNEAELIALASQSLRPTAPPVPAPAAAASGSPAAVATPPAAPPAVPAAAAPAAPVPAPAVPSGQPDDLDAPLAPEVLATLGDAGQRALQSEREKRKEARQTIAELRAENERLKAAAPVTPPAPSAPEVPPPAPDPASPPVVVPPVAALAECKTSADVDAVVLRAVRDAASAMELNTLLNTSGLDSVVQRFEAAGVKEFRGVPLADLTPEVLARELATTYQQAQEIQLTAPQQRQVIDLTRQNMLRAVDALPGLKDPNSAVRKQFNALASNPAVRALGPEWPVYLAHNILGQQQAAAAPKPGAAPSPAPLPPTPVPAAVPPPPAPRTSVPPPSVPNVQDEIAAKLAAGTATEKDMARLASAALRTAAPVGAPQ